MFTDFIKDEFMIAYRFIEKNSDGLLGNDRTPFSNINNVDKFWFADPLLFKYKGKVYLFFEAYNKQRCKGEIGYCEVSKEGGITQPKIVLSEVFHMSYPFIFELNDKIYMIPETSESKKLFLYEAIDFPNKWCRNKVLLEDIELVDATLFEYNNQKYLYASELTKDVLYGNVLHLYKLNNNLDLIKCYTRPIVNDIKTARPAGRVLKLKDKILRPSQDCSDSNYGKQLVFNEVNEINPDSYKENIYTIIGANNLPIKFNKRLTGIHTYDRFENIEVIDVKYPVQNYIYGIKVTIYKFLRKILNIINVKVNL